MGSALPLDLLIDITSTGVKDAFTIGKLNTILIEKYNSDLPNAKFIECFDLSTTQSVFGTQSNTAKFAGVYFGVISKSATKADRLFVYNWNESDTPAILKGAKLSSLSEVKALNGKFKLTLGADTAEISVNFDSADSFASAANLLQTAIRSADGQDDNENSYSLATLHHIQTNNVLYREVNPHKERLIFEALQS